MVRLVFDVWFWTEGLLFHVRPSQTLSDPLRASRHISRAFRIRVSSNLPMPYAGVHAKEGSARSLVRKGLQAAFSATSVELAYALQSLVVVELSRTPLTCDPNPQLGLPTGRRLGLDHALITKWEHLLGKFSDGSFVCGEGWASTERPCPLLAWQTLLHWLMYIIYSMMSCGCLSRLCGEEISLLSSFDALETPMYAPLLPHVHHMHSV